MKKTGLFIIEILFCISLTAQTAINKVPLRDYNSIDSISASSSQIKYFSASGCLIYNKKDSTYCIDTISTKFPRYRGIPFEWSDFPLIMMKFVGGTYQSLIDSTTIGTQGKLLLFSVTGEGCGIGDQRVVDTKNHIVYQISGNSLRCFSADDNMIYLGGRGGIKKIVKRNNSIFSKIVLPIFNKETSYFETENNIWLATDHLYIQRVNKKDGSLTYWNPSNIVDKELTNPFYSNIVETGDYIILGCRGARSDHVIESYHSFLFLFSKKNQTWTSIEANCLKGLEKLVVKGDIIFIGAHHVVEYEGCDYTIYGGFGYYNLGSDYIETVYPISEKEIITQIKDRDNIIEIQTHIPSCSKPPIMQYRFDTKTKTILTSEKMNIKLDDFYNSTDIIPIHRKAKQNYERNKKSLDQISVVPQIITVFPQEFFKAIKYGSN